MKRESVRSLKKKVWKKFSLYIRLKHADENGFVECYTCGRKMHWKEAQAGHGLGGRGNSILFDEEIVKPQCYRCNVEKGGAYDEFHDRLIREYGEEWFHKKVQQKHTPKNFTVSELRQLLKEIEEKLVSLKGGGDECTTNIENEKTLS